MTITIKLQIVYKFHNLRLYLRLIQDPTNSRQKKTNCYRVGLLNWWRLADGHMTILFSQLALLGVFVRSMREVMKLAKSKPIFGPGPSDDIAASGC